MSRVLNYTWRSIPILKVLIPFIVGILIQYNIQLPFTLLLPLAALFLVLTFCFNFLTLEFQFVYNWIRGVFISITCLFFGTIVTYQHNIENNFHYFKRIYKEKDAIKVTIEEPLQEKEKSYKAEATINAVLNSGIWTKASGKIIIYFKKDSKKPSINYGNQLVFASALQPIGNTGNPGGFDYKKYCLFKGITYQVFLTSNKYQKLSTVKVNWINQLLFQIRDSVLCILRKYLLDKNNAALAEALLIGYRNDLDKDLLQAYSNSGIVHIIAISGMHLGMIYGSLQILFFPFQKRKWCKFFKPICILSVIWLFTLLAGAVPSILRSAVMFSFLIAAEILDKRTNTYNTLAASAFTMLLFNPYCLWDLGFLLSYAAIISILLYSKPIRNCFYFKNKILSSVWNMCSVTLSAQILTLPIILFYFHQFPNFFLFTNLLAVPLSGWILYLEILLLITFKIPIIGLFITKISSVLLSFMNDFVSRVAHLPFATWNGIQINLLQLLFLYLFILLLSSWLLYKKKKYFLYSLFVFLLFTIVRSVEIIKTRKQQKIIVYNIPKHTAIDIIQGNHFHFITDSGALNNNYLIKNNLANSRILHRITSIKVLDNIKFNKHLIYSRNKKILLFDQSIQIKAATRNTINHKVDAIILTQNTQVNIHSLKDIFECSKYVFDASNSLWKIKKWIKECKELHLPYHTVSTNGAFVMNL